MSTPLTNTEVRLRPGIFADESEEEFLERQASEAKEAIGQTLREVFDVRGHVRQHPWWSVTVSCLAGVAAGGMMRHRSHSVIGCDWNSPARKKSAISPLVTTLFSEAVKFLIPTLFTGAVLAKAEERSATQSDSYSSEMS